MKQVSEMPTSGQFVAVFQRFGFVEVRSYEFSDINPIAVYVIDQNNSDGDGKYKDKIPVDFINSFFASQKATFFIAD